MEIEIPPMLIGEHDTYEVNADDFAEIVKEYMSNKYGDLWVWVIEDLIWELWSK